MLGRFNQADWGAAWRRAVGQRAGIGDGHTVGGGTKTSIDPGMTDRGQVEAGPDLM